MSETLLSKQEIDFVIEKLQTGKELPEDLKYKLFPLKQRECELNYGGKMRKEDLLANEDGVFPAPLQIEKVFNGDKETFKCGWRNMIIFGDNLQFLKTIYENKDPLIKDKVKGKVKLIYIDPPFASDEEFKGNSGQYAYNDKKKSSEFIEYIRRRLILTKEVLAEEGSIYIHLDQKMVHYIKIIMDEVFGKHCFRNTVIWHYGGRMMHKVKQFNRKHDVILFYTKNSKNYKFKLPFEQVDFEQYAKNRHEKIHTDENGKRYLLAPDATMERTLRQYEDDIVQKGRAIDDVWEIRYIRGNAKERTGYPTQKPEDLLKRLILASTEENDLVMDFFAGSGTLAAVAEKLGRRWIVADIGKLAFYMTQKRILNIKGTKSLENPARKHEKSAKSFITVNTGIYDLKKVFKLKNEDYEKFVMELFEIEPLKEKIGGILIQGQKKDGYYCLIYPYWQFRDSAVDEEYLEDLHSHIGNKIGERLYIVAPANYIDFISDYYEIGKVKYYFLKVPYQIIRELHKVNFKKFRQPQRKSNINDMEDSIGFHFIRQPHVKTEISTERHKIKIKIKEFFSDFSEEESGTEMENFESLAMILVDNNYNGNAFELDNCFFAEDLLPDKNPLKSDDVLKDDLKSQREIVIQIDKASCGKEIMAIYIDIYGNEFKEVLKVK